MRCGRICSIIAEGPRPSHLSESWSRRDTLCSPWVVVPTVSGEPCPKGCTCLRSTPWDSATYQTLLRGHHPQYYQSSLCRQIFTNRKDVSKQFIKEWCILPRRNGAGPEWEPQVWWLCIHLSASIYKLLQLSNCNNLCVYFL